jgi:hypothetical protein
VEARRQAQAPRQSRNQVKRFIVAIQGPQRHGKTEWRPQLDVIYDIYNGKRVLDWVWQITSDDEASDIASYLGAHAAPGWRIVVVRFDEWACWPIHNCEDTKSP